jgi:predicted transcriptional regulator
MSPYPRGRAQLLTAISLLAAVWISSPLGPARAAIPPTFSSIAELEPNGGEILRGGAPYLVRWNATLDYATELPTTIEFSADSGANYTLLDAGNHSTGGASYNWTVPTIDTTLGRVRVCVDEGGGNWSCLSSAGDFSIDSTSPVILSTEPADGAINVSRYQPLRIAFSEKMDQTSISIILVPAVGLTFSWSSQSDLEVTPSTGWSVCINVTISVSAGDLAGNPLAPGPVPNPWTFAVTCGYPYVVSTLPSDGAAEVIRWADLQVAFSEPMDPSTVTWELSPPIRLTPSWSGGSDVLTLSFKETTARLNVTANPDYYDGNPDWICRQRWPNSEVINVTANTSAIAVSIRAAGPGDNDLAVFRDANGNGVCDYGIDVLVGQSLGPTPMEDVTVGTSGPGRYLAQVGLWGAGSELFNITVTHFRAMDPCTAYTVTVWAQDFDGNDLTTGPAPNPWNFTTDCASPFIASTSPSDGSAGVSRNDPLVISFSEGMDPNSIGIGFAPPVSGKAYTWDSQYKVLTVAHDLFLPCTEYRVSVAARDPSGNDLLPGPVPNPWSFTTSCAPSASVHVLSPKSGDSWTGGTNHSVSFEIENAETFARTFAISAVFRYAGGTQEGNIGSTNVTVTGGTTVSGEFPWSVPALDGTDVLVSVRVSDANLALVAETPTFEIDSTPPRVLTGTPLGSRIPLPVDLIIGFSESMAPPASDPLGVVPPVGRAVTWSSPGVLHVALSGVLLCTGYDVSIGAPLTDDSEPGNPLLPFAWSFATTCAPTIDLVTPVGGEDGTGGSVHAISWTSADPDDDVLDVTLSYSADAGATWVREAAFVVEVGPATYTWTLPRIEVSDVLVRAEVSDSRGNVASDTSPPFAIDATPPYLRRSSPESGERDVAVDGDITLEWSERVDRASFEAAFSSVPRVDSLALVWSIGGEGTDILTIRHDLLETDTEYSLSFASTAKDLSDPGNSLAAPFALRFRTVPLPPTFLPVAWAVGPSQAQAGEPVALDGTRSTGDLVGYEWRITDDRGRLVVVLSGASSSHVFRDPGHFVVALLVTDVRGDADTDAFEIEVTSSPTGWIALGGALLFAAALSTTEGGKFFVLKLLLVPLYARRRRNELLEHQTRGMILGYLMVHPGDTYTHLKRNLQLTNGTLSYHLVVLEREGILRGQTYGVHKRFFPVGVRVPEDGGGLHEVQMRMLGAIREVPGLAVKDIAGALGITSQHALYHIRGLAAKGLVRLERKGVRLRCFPDGGPTPTPKEP